MKNLPTLRQLRRAPLHFPPLQKVAEFTAGFGLALSLINGEGVAGTALILICCTSAIVCRWWHLHLIPRFARWATYRSTAALPVEQLQWQSRRTLPGEDRYNLHRLDCRTLNWTWLALIPTGGAWVALLGIFFQRLAARLNLGVSKEEALHDVLLNLLPLAGAVALGQWLITAQFFFIAS
jgi:hypothetical protein